MSGSGLCRRAGEAEVMRGVGRGADALQQIPGSGRSSV